MEPKNRVFCRECSRPKMLFESEKKAQLFMKYNNEDFDAENRQVPVRAYYCEACCGWHLTHITDPLTGPSKTEQAIKRMRTSINMNRESKKRTSAIRSEISNKVVSQLAIIDKHIANNENTEAKKLIDELLEMNKTKYISPKLLKLIKGKKRLIDGNLQQ